MPTCLSRYLVEMLLLQYPVYIVALSNQQPPDLEKC